MRSPHRWTLLAGCVFALGCLDDTTAPAGGSRALRVVNGFPGDVAVLLDGVQVATLPAGAIDTLATGEGTHQVMLRQVGGSASSSLTVDVGTGMRSLAAIRAGGALSSVALDDTNAVVPAGATKVRVLHLAPSAGEITVMRTQPDYGTPVQWQFPFTYSENISALGNPFYQSTVGTWEVRGWRKPSEDALGWAGTQARVTLTLASGQKRTVVVLDREGGGIRLAVID